MRRDVKTFIEVGFFYVPVFVIGVIVVLGLDWLLRWLF